MSNKKWRLAFWVPVEDDPQMKRMHVFYCKTKHEAFICRLLCISRGYEVDEIEKVDQE